MVVPSSCMVQVRDVKLLGRSSPVSACVERVVPRTRVAIHPGDPFVDVRGGTLIR